ncbi:UvrD-helicase domain-containing protein [Eubacteriales bacterium KG125]
MTDTMWNDGQKTAIHEDGKNLLVAAAAGSGKTAVLVERIKRLILDGTPIDRMLIVTFTNAATADMKAKIRKDLKKAIVHADSQEVRELFRKQIDMLGNANISNFHGFAMSVIKQFFHYINGLEPGFKVEDELKIAIIKERIIDELLYEYFNLSSNPSKYEIERNRAFFQYLDRYTDGRRFDKLKEQILQAHESFRNIPNYKIEVKNLIQELYSLSTGAELLNWRSIKEVLQIEVMDAAKAVLRDYEDTQELALNLGLHEFSRLMIQPKKVEFAQNVINLLKMGDYKEVKLRIDKVGKWEAKKFFKDRPEDEGKIFDEYKKKFDVLGGTHSKYKAIKTKLDILSGNTEIWDSRVKYINDTKIYVDFFLDMVFDFDKKFQEEKLKSGVIDFADIEHFAIELLERPEISKFYKDRFEYIFVDEYQDTSSLQEYVINQISREDNIFMVGDVKQSIYKFRNAEPEIFMEKYQKFSDCLEGSNRKVDLNYNYRSKETILNTVNDIFFDLMEGYNNETKLNLGIKDERVIEYPTKLYWVEDANKEIESSRDSEELENLQIARIIKEHIGKPYFDNKSGKLKTIGYSDIVILSRSLKDYGPRLSRQLNELEIPNYVTKKEDIFDAIEVRIFINLLKVIDNKLQDLALISVLKSSIFGFKDSEIAEIASVDGSHFFYKIKEYIASGKEAKIIDNLCVVIDMLEGFEQKSVELDLNQFIWDVLQESRYFLLVGAMPMGDIRQANLHAIIDLSLDFQEYGEATLSGFLEYINKVKSNKALALPEADIMGEGGNAVRIMTIHNSKGLEFPMVILARFNKGSRSSAQSLALPFHKKIGLGLDYVNLEEKVIKKSIVSELINSFKELEEKEEALRVLYVALTRATDILCVSGADNNRNSGTSFFKLVKWKGEKVICTPEMLRGWLQEEKLSVDREEHTEIQRQSIEKVTYDDVAKRLSYKYPYSIYKGIIPKYTATGLNELSSAEKCNIAPEDEFRVRQCNEDFALLSKPKFLVKDVEKYGVMNAAERGSIYHKIFEFCQYSRAVEEGLNYLEVLIKQLISNEIIDENMANQIHLKHIDDFFKSDLAKRMAKAEEEGKLHKEQSFILSIPISDPILEDFIQDLELSTEGEESIRVVDNDERVIVQGVIDAFFEETNIEEDSYFVIVDFKSNQIREDKVEEEKFRIKSKYDKQMQVYKRALEAGIGIVSDDKLKVKETYIYLVDGKTCVLC